MQTFGEYYIFAFMVLAVSALSAIIAVYRLPALIPVGVAAGALPRAGWFWASSTEEKTEEATPHRRQEARKKGQVSRSTDLNAAVVIVIIILCLYLLRESLVFDLTGFIQHILAQEMIHELDRGQLFTLYRFFFTTYLGIMGPIFAIAIFIGLLINFLQVGFLFAPEAIRPKASNINPVEGFKKIFSKKALFECLKTILKVLVVGTAIYILIKNKLESILLMPDMNIFAIINYLEKTIFEICIGAALVFLVIAVLDFAFQKWQFKQNLKMSKHEVKQEMKQTEGDPLIKSRIRERQRIMARNRMMQSIPEATVVITNPTHLAVALKYDGDEMEAPQLVAKGADFLAQKIKAKAQANDIPIMEDVQLAHLLYENVEIGDFIPEDLYQAVAAVIAAIYLLKQERR